MPIGRSLCELYRRKVKGDGYENSVVGMTTLFFVRGTSCTSETSRSRGSRSSRNTGLLVILDIILQVRRWRCRFLRCG